MTDSVPLLTASPVDPTPDAGPVHRGGPFTYFVLLTCSLSALGSGLVLEQQGQPWWGVAAIVLFGAFGLRSGYCLFQRLRHRGSLPRLHAVLSDVLAFRLHCTCRDVAATVFFDPDTLAAGGSLRLLCFLENYASRQRIVRLRFGPHPALGLEAPRLVDLHLAAGQAAVYVVPLVVAKALRAGEHDLPVTLQVHKVTGTGVRLPGSHRHLYDLWTVHFAAPFTIGSSVATPPIAAAGAPEFLTLASISEPSPRLDALAFLNR